MPKVRKGRLGGRQKIDRDNAEIDGKTKHSELMQRIVQLTFWPCGVPGWRSAREVGRELGISTTTVTNLLRQAVVTGLVVPFVCTSHQRKQAIDLEERLRRKFGLKRVMLVPGGPDGDRALSGERRAVRERVVDWMVARAADYLHELLAPLAARSQPVFVGNAWGWTMRRLADHLLAMPTLELKNVHFIPIAGITAARRREPVEANVIAADLAHAFGGKSGQLPAPAFAVRRDAEKLKGVKAISEMLRLVAECEVVLTSMGPLLSGELDSIGITNDERMNAKLVKQARENGAVGEVCGVFFGKEGGPVDCEYTAIGLGHGRLRELARNKNVVLICGGDPRRVHPLRIALQAGLASVLISDTETARGVLNDYAKHQRG